MKDVLERVVCTNRPIIACNCSTGQRQQERSQLSLQTQCWHQKQCSKWPSSALADTERRRRHWCTAAAMTAWSSLVHSVLMRSVRSSRSVARLLYTFSCSMPHTLYSTGFKSGEFGGNNRGGMNSEVSLFAKTSLFNDVKMTSSLRTSCTYWWDFLQLFSQAECQDDSCQKLWSLLNLSKLWPKYYQSNFFQVTV